MAQATRTELAKRQQQQQQVSTIKPKTALKSEAKSSEATAPASSNKQKPSYKHIPHSQKPPHLVAKRNARERRRVKAVNEAFNTLKKCVPIQNRNKRVSKVKTLQRAIDHIRHLQAILEADNEAAGTSGAGQHRIFVSSKAGEEAEMRLAMSPEPRCRSNAPPTTKVTKTSSSASLRQQVDNQQQGQKQRRGRKPNAIKQQEGEAPKQQQQQVSSNVLVEQQQQQANQHYLIESQTNEYASVQAEPAHYYGLSPATCHTASGSQRAAPYAYEAHQHYQNYETAAHYYQPAFHEQYQPHTPTYGTNFYTAAAHQVPYGDTNSAQRQHQPMSWQPALSSTNSTRSSGCAPLDSSSSQLSASSPANSANLTQLMCNLNTSNSSSECSSSGPNASASCLYNGNAQHHHQRRAMPADSTTSSAAAAAPSSASNNSANNTSSSSNKSASSLIDSPYSTTSSSSISSASNSFNGGGGGNKSLDSSAPLNLKHAADKSSPTSAGGRQVNNYANNNYALPTFVYDPSERQQPDDGAKLIGRQQRQKPAADATHSTTTSVFSCGGDSTQSDLYLADSQAHLRHQQQATNYAPNSSMDFHKHHSPLLGHHQMQLGMVDERAPSNGLLYNGGSGPL